MITVNFPPVLITKLVENSSIAFNNDKYELFIFKKQE